MSTDRKMRTSKPSMDERSAVTTMEEIIEVERRRLERHVPVRVDQVDHFVRGGFGRVSLRSDFSDLSKDDDYRAFDKTVAKSSTLKETKVMSGSRHSMTQTDESSFKNSEKRHAVNIERQPKEVTKGTTTEGQYTSYYVRPRASASNAPVTTLPKSSLLPKSALPSSASMVRQAQSLIRSKEELEKDSELRTSVSRETLGRSRRSASPSVWTPSRPLSTSSRPALVNKSLESPKSNYYSSPNVSPKMRRRHYSNVSCDGVIVDYDRNDNNEFWHSSQLRDRSDHHDSKNFGVVVAIDIGTTYSGYAYSIVEHDEENLQPTVQLMRKWEGDDPGVSNAKVPSALLLTPNRDFHSFGFGARDFYADLNPQEARKWLYFDDLKSTLSTDVHRDHLVKAKNNTLVRAKLIWSLVLSFFKDKAMREVSEQCGYRVNIDNVRFVVTVPAVWRLGAKQLVREAAHQAGMGNDSHRDHLLIALEAEAASLFCRQQRPDHEGRYVVVDCGGVGVAVTVHDVFRDEEGRMREAFKATTAPFGAANVDAAFLALLAKLLGRETVTEFSRLRPSGFCDLITSFEAKKRQISDNSKTAVNVAMPFELADFVKKQRGKDLNELMTRKSVPGLQWIKAHGTLRIEPWLMVQLFQPTIDGIIKQVSSVLSEPSVGRVRELFVVGGFAASPLLQSRLRSALDSKVNVIIPGDHVGVAVLKGAVLHGLNPWRIRVRRIARTFGIGVIRHFREGIDPHNKMIRRDGHNWCLDVFDKFVSAGQSLSVGETVSKRYKPVNIRHGRVVLGIYSTTDTDPKFITDAGVESCGSLILSLRDCKEYDGHEIETKLVFGDTEIRATATHIDTGRSVGVTIDFLKNDDHKAVTKL